MAQPMPVRLPAPRRAKRASRALGSAHLNTSTQAQHSANAICPKPNATPSDEAPNSSASPTPAPNAANGNA